ncbi:MAG: glycosyltransferase [Candidatus Nitrosocosmicus sp.]|nr:glycosyltransferase [Candidatus Nitrosocosmicus sp.]
MDLSKPFSATPALWQLFKAFYEENHELLIIPYQGNTIDSLWWKSYQNPNYYKGFVLEKLLKKFKGRHTNGKGKMIPRIARSVAKPSIVKLMKKILNEEKDIEAVLLIAVPLNQLNGLPSEIKTIKNLPIVYYDLDLPTSLPKYGGFTFNYYVDAKVNDYDSFIITSEGSKDDLLQLGVKKVHFVHFGVDPTVYSPIDIEKNTDFFFFGNGGKSRMNNIDIMVTQPSKILNKRFLASGRDLNINLGNTELISPLSFTRWKIQCCQSKINLNVVRELHANVYATSTSRPFELAAMRCCIVSAPYKGLENWFEIGKEMYIINSLEECIDTYQMLLDNEDLRNKVSTAAYNRVQKEHTSKHRVREIVNILNKI